MLLRVRPEGAPLTRGIVLLLGLAVAASAARAQEELLQELRSVHHVGIVGNRHVGDRELRDVLKTHSRGRWPWSERPPLRIDFLRADTTSLCSYYRHLGYLDAHAEWRFLPRRDPNEVDVEFQVDEGGRTDIGTVTLVMSRSDLDHEIRKHLYARPRRPFDPAFLQLDTLVISSIYQDHGYRPHVFASSRLDSARRIASIRYDVLEGPIYQVGDVYVSGYNRVPERLITRELLIHRGDTYSRDKMKRSQERLYDTGLFDQVQITTLPDSTQTLVEYDLRVRERKSRWIEAAVGSGTDERFRLTASWGHRNLFQRGMQSAVTGLVSLYGTGELQRARLDYSLVEPWLFRTRTRGQIAPFAELKHDRSDPRWVNNQRFVGFNVVVHRDLNRWTQTALTFQNVWAQQELEFLQTLDPVTLDSVTANTLPHYRTHLLQLSFGRDTRDSPIVTTRGSAMYVLGELAGGPLGGNTNYTKAELVPAWYTPTRRFIVATRVRAGVMAPFKETTAISPGEDPRVAAIPLENRFRVGGVNSVRGYAENTIPPTGGLSVLLGTVELRAPLAQISKLGSIGVELFVDAGNVWTRPGAMRIGNLAPTVSRTPLGGDDVRWVFGVGPRLETPIGPLRFDWSWNFRPVTDVRGYLVPVLQFAIGPSF
ncbi:MAG: outer membrane protein assembly factor [Candidatus Eisenbacteria bacterium]